MTKHSEVKRQTNHGQTGLSNMLVKKNILNEINKEGTFIPCRKIKRKVSQKLDDLQNLLIKLSQLRESVTTLEFPFSLDPGDKQNDAQA